MNAKVEKLENSQVKLEVTIEADKFEEGMQKAFFRNAKHFNVPGFRKGKAPRNIVERYYGELYCQYIISFCLMNIWIKSKKRVIALDYNLN